MIWINGESKHAPEWMTMDHKNLPFPSYYIYQNSYQNPMVFVLIFGFNYSLKMNLGFWKWRMAERELFYHLFKNILQRCSNQNSIAIIIDTTVESNRKYRLDPGI